MTTALRIAIKTVKAYRDRGMSLLEAIEKTCQECRLSPEERADLHVELGERKD